MFHEISAPIVMNQPWKGNGADVQFSMTNLDKLKFSILGVVPPLAAILQQMNQKLAEILDPLL